MYRHGDVLIAPVESIPDDARRLRHTVLAEGEITGHCHRVEPSGVAELSEAGSMRYLDVTGEGARVVHEEHDPIELPVGTYRVWRQREYTPDSIRTIQD